MSEVHFPGILPNCSHLNYRFQIIVYKLVCNRKTQFPQKSTEHHRIIPLTLIMTVNILKKVEFLQVHVAYMKGWHGENRKSQILFKLNENLRTHEINDGKKFGEKIKSRSSTVLCQCPIFIFFRFLSNYRFLPETQYFLDLII